MRNHSPPTPPYPPSVSAESEGSLRTIAFMENMMSKFEDDSLEPSECFKLVVDLPYQKLTVASLEDAFLSEFSSHT
ncbi:unnamed protein product [Lactuca virosa]|uniref:Uncharacterized protein n=1 Tax=Lactuca virosa TaxID=75947 RepID=A0AAU9NZF2_9ASTR|nr:unnamed protein product [Lactuca virosa]